MENPMKLRMRGVAIGLLLAVGCLLVGAQGVEAATKKVSMLDRLLAPQGTAVVNLAKGTVAVKATLDPLPATIDTGTGTFQATIYKAYLVSSADAAMEIPLGSVYPTAKKKASLAAALKGDLSSTDFAFDRVVIVAYSKDGLSSFDVLTGTIQ
jgi:uncharacterized membrane protein